MKQTSFSNFEKDGFLVLPDYFTVQEVGLVSEEIMSIHSAPGVDVYLDRAGQLRRLEHFTYRSDFLTGLNHKVEALLHQIIGEPYALFKDKFNFKPPGGEGFSAHYDGVFEFQTGDGQPRKGWYEYASRFVSVLVAVDPFTEENGALEIARAHSGNFDYLLSKTRKDGSPHLNPEVEEAAHFTPIVMKEGGVAVFKNSCPHRSGPNNSQESRGSLYLTYSPKREGAHYSVYFEDKKKSKNDNKALTGPTFEG